MELKINDNVIQRKDWEEFQRDLNFRLRNSAIMVMQLVKLLDLCDAELAKFPDEVIEAPEAVEAAKEVEALATEEVKNE